MADSNELISLFKSIGLSESKAKEAAKSPKGSSLLKQLIDTYGLAKRSPPLNEKQAGLVSALSAQLAKLDPVSDENVSVAVRKILDGKLMSVDQATEAAKYVASHPSPIDEADFDRNCGIGVNITLEDVQNKVKDYMSTNVVTGWPNLGSVISALRSSPDLRWANAIEIKNTVEKAFMETFGPKTTATKMKATEPKTSKSSKPTSDVASASTSSSASRKTVFEEGFLGSLHKPGDNPQLSAHLRDAHMAATGGQVWTRFPPEPNGYLHIGHSKAIFVNFGYAAHHGGKTYLRYDDTNPEKEEQQYFESILEMVRWLGYEPWKITYSSDYFPQLYDLAVELIKREKAYVCHCTQEQIKVDRGESRGKPRPCIHRDRPIAESLTEFENMKNGKYKPKEANLRMKQDLEDGNPQMWDLTAYRVLDSPHHRTGDKWKIYPTYDFTHCLVDSFENISHSLCTVEFVASRQSYEWLCDALEVYKPRQSEYGRLSLEGTLMSKRKIQALVDEKHVNGWDDPRLYTLTALRRRGIPPEAIISFVSTLGVSTATTTIETARFEQSVRQYLELTAPRLMMVLKPLKITIENLAEDYVTLIEQPLHPKVPELGSRTVPFTRTIYIDVDDFRTEDSKDYFRLAPGKTVGLFQAPYPITCTSYTTDPDTDAVTELKCRIEEGNVKKPKAFIQWVADHPESGSPVRIDDTRFFRRLLNSDNPPSDFRSDLNPDSLAVVKGAFVEVGFYQLAKRMIDDARKKGKDRTARALKAAHNQPSSNDTPHATAEQLVGSECVRFQGVRVAYFTLDKDTRLAYLDEINTEKPARTQEDYIVLNQIVAMKEDTGKSS